MIQIVGKTYQVPRELLEKVAKAAFSVLGIKSADIELKYVSVSEISRLNTLYRGKTGPTDVLSFALGDKPICGQIFICYNFMVKQATALGKTLSDESALLLVHGILHILGHDHIDDADAVVMVSLEKKILDKVGIQR